MTRPVKAAVLWIVMVGPLALGGCGFIVSPSVHDNWGQRLAGLEHNLQVSRTEIDKLATHALNNQLNWAEAAAGKEGWPDQDLQDTKMAVRDRTETQRRFLLEIGTVEDELALLRGEILGGSSW
jgi:hypothetical protein